ncbi:hypothetical protein Daus18300_010275 [Diaporthe australafricana]|uniref:NACHT domain-containing protein n=1 Tax=Diaporthe australafricana TaxID=127596 RepID=A0ABR3WB57_9PEZI
MSTGDASQQAFETAKKSFRKTLKDEALFRDILETTSIENVWEAVKAVQAKQDAEKRLRNMGKIRGFLDKLSAYAVTVDTLIQVKPDIMALIWGPIRLLLVWTGNITKFADAISKVMMKVGDALPQFVDVVNIFGDKEKLKAVLALFYKDILDFHAIALEFFNLSRPQIFFESVWPRQQDKIDVVISNIERHTTLLRSEVTMQHIREEHELRAKSLTHFDQQAEFQDQQRFQTLKTRMSPRTYDERLDWLLNRSYQGSAEWLVKNKSFLDWLEMSNTATRWLWIHGIPGSGKTFLCATMVTEAKARHRTLFAFASHIHQNTSTARCVLQSLVFQLAFDSKDAQIAIVHSDERNLSGSTTYVSGLLKALLKSIGPTYIILDGLDEMDAVERRILLQQLDELNDCTEVKILVSSRPEDDIGNTLAAKAVGIRVDKENSAGIQTYVNQRTHNWLNGEGFDQEARRQIKSLLLPLTGNANGMFLYARIILDNAELLTSLEEIEGELKALPLDLNDAYHRIFARINESHPILRRKARTILGWIGCAPVPLTRLEMEQALLVDPDSQAAPTVITSVNFVRTCGPMVELVDEIPQFVHFTAQEYIFSRDISNFIDKAEANYSLAKSTIAHLCSGIYDMDISDEQVRNNIVAGKYRLHWFATSQWTALISRCFVEASKDLSAYPDLLELLTRLALELRNYGFKGQISRKEGIFQSLESNWPEISNMICGVLAFRRDDRQTDWNYTNASKWVDSDPSILSLVSARVYEQFEKLVCSDQEHSKTDCHCATLQRHYGGNIFRCTFPSCDLHRQGFPSRRARAAHIQHHARPWKCSESECPFAIIGFAKSRDRDEHWRKRHQVTWQKGHTDPSQATITPDDLEVLLFELTKAGDVGGLQKALCLLGCHVWLSKPALILAAKMGSLPMVETFSVFMKDGPVVGGSNGTLFGRVLQRDTVPFQTAIVRSGNCDLFRWLLDEMCGLEDCHEYKRLAGEAFSTHSPDMYAVWEEFLLDPTRRLAGAYNYYSEGGEETDPDGGFREAKKLLLQYNKRSALFDSPAFGSAAKDVFCEARLFQTWQRLIDVLGGGPLNPRFLGWSLTRLAKMKKPSISIAKELLRLGAPINFPRGEAGAIATTTTPATADAASRTHDGRVERRTRRQTRHRGMTALHNAAHGTSEAAARFTRFLLEEGADPEYGFAGMKPMTERGAVLMEKWLGESWEAVVARTGEARKERRETHGENDEYSESDDDDWREEGDESDRGGGRAKRRKTRRAGKKRNVDSSEDGGDDDSQVGRESDQTAKRRRSQRITEKRNMKESSDDEDTDMSNDGE